MWFHLYEISSIGPFIVTEGRLVVISGVREGKWGDAAQWVSGFLLKQWKYSWTRCGFGLHYVTNGKVFGMCILPQKKKKSQKNSFRNILSFGSYQSFTWGGGGSGNKNRILFQSWLYYLRAMWPWMTGLIPLNHMNDISFLEEWPVWIKHLQSIWCIVFDV